MLINMYLYTKSNFSNLNEFRHDITSFDRAPKIILYLSVRFIFLMMVNLLTDIVFRNL